MLKNNLRIVSRNSRLALQQANIVKAALQQITPNLTIDIIGITTRGDQILDQPLNKIGGKGLFISELENYLLENRADIAVHSMKDVPAILPEELAIGAILKRADPRDVLISMHDYSVENLPPRAIIGTSSLRRQSQVLAVRNDLIVSELRGNVETRLKKLIDGKYTAIILAYAGLQRLDLDKYLACPLHINSMLPAVGQGALGVEYRKQDSAIKQLIARLNDPISDFCVRAERAMNAKLDGGCQAPVAGLAVVKNDILTLMGLVGSSDGKIILHAEQSGLPEDAELIGERVADLLNAQGADKIIKALKC